MPSTRAFVSYGRGEAVPEDVPETLVRGKCRGRFRGCSHGVTPTRGRAKEGTLLRMLGSATCIPQCPQTRVGAKTPEVSEDETIQFQGGKSEDAHEFLTLRRDMLDAIGLVNARGLHFVTLQLCGPAREW
ncbi:hypothetical protein KY284_007941 [Solanum tuberosum]|nr:hypothetical protein KY284_007941 [Solanum tuberosum]